MRDAQHPTNERPPFVELRKLAQADDRYRPQLILSVPQVWHQCRKIRRYRRLGGGPQTRKALGEIVKCHWLKIVTPPQWFTRIHRDREQLERSQHGEQLVGGVADAGWRGSLEVSIRRF